MMGDEKSLYTYKGRRLPIHTIEQIDKRCKVCDRDKLCTYVTTLFEPPEYICDKNCMEKLNANEFSRYIVKPKDPRLVKAKALQKLAPKPKLSLLKLKVISNATDKYLDEAYKIKTKTPAMIQAARDERDRTFVRCCQQCSNLLKNDDRNLTWETMDFCSDVCLGRYQNQIGYRCANCKSIVTNTSLGKYCVRFGYDIRQFCNSSCLEEFKKGLKICCYCQKDISAGHQGFLAPVGDKGQFKDFCSQACMAKFDQMSKNPVPPPVMAKCAVCSLEKSTNIEVEINEHVQQRLCSDPCFAAFKFVNNILPGEFYFDCLIRTVKFLFFVL